MELIVSSLTDMVGVDGNVARGVVDEENIVSWIPTR
jgi:hypothetical protein